MVETARASSYCCTTSTGASVTIAELLVLKQACARARIQSQSIQVSSQRASAASQQSSKTQFMQRTSPPSGSASASAAKPQQGVQPQPAGKPTAAVLQSTGAASLHRPQPTPSPATSSGENSVRPGPLPHATGAGQGTQQAGGPSRLPNQDTQQPVGAQGQPPPRATAADQLSALQKRPRQALQGPQP